MSDCDRNGDEDEVADPAELLCQLKRLYWDGTEREICSMILAYQEIHQHHPRPIASEEDVRVLEGENFKKIFDLWCTYGAPALCRVCLVHSANLRSLRRTSPEDSLVEPELYRSENI